MQQYDRLTPTEALKVQYALRSDNRTHVALLASKHILAK